MSPSSGTVPAVDTASEIDPAPHPASPRRGHKHVLDPAEPASAEDSSHPVTEDSMSDSRAASKVRGFVARPWVLVALTTEAYELVTGQKLTCGGCSCPSGAS